MTDDDDHGHWVTDDPGLIAWVNVSNPQCGRACLPLSEWAPLCDEIAKLNSRIAMLQDTLGRIAQLAVSHDRS